MKKNLFISLGYNCDIKGTIRRIDKSSDSILKKKYVYSQESLPFDWCITYDINNILNCIQHNFKLY